MKGESSTSDAPFPPSDSRAESVAVIRAIVALSNSLGIEIIAEAVETLAQRDSLRELGCTYAQGFLFGQPAQRSH